MNETSELPTFQQLNLTPPLLKALKDLGYESPSPIQAEIIPLVMAGNNVLGQAQTGTGKTAAFALPLLTQLDLRQAVPQILVLAPTRELVIQVAEAFQKYASYMPGFHVMPIYGGQEYQTQLKQLKRGVHVVVGTPGRVMDHMRRGTLKLETIRCLVLDEADEMLRIGFLGDVEWILEQIPAERQIALFSATMPEAIRRIAKKHLKDAKHVTIKVKTTTAENIRQRYWPVNNDQKIDALTRILEAETYDGILIFVRTKTATLELTEKLSARGYAVAALNGDIAQKQRIRTVDQLKKGDLDIVVATDVAARGLDVQRISHVINYDIPHDTESYVHRIGRTGRAGRSGEAILFISPREKHLLNIIEKATRQKIELMELPSVQTVNDKRVARFTQQITDTIGKADLSYFSQLLEDYQREHNVPAIEIAAALAILLQGPKPFLMKQKDTAPAFTDRSEDFSRKSSGKGREKFAKSGFEERKSKFSQDFPDKRSARKPSGDKELFRVEVGRDDGVKPANIMGAIANEVGFAKGDIGQIQIFDDFSTVELPTNLSKDVLQHLKSVWTSNKQLNISRVGAGSSGGEEYKPRARPKTGAAPRSRAGEGRPRGAGSEGRPRSAGGPRGAEGRPRAGAEGRPKSAGGPKSWASSKPRSESGAGREGAKRGGDFKFKKSADKRPGKLTGKPAPRVFSKSKAKPSRDY